MIFTRSKVGQRILDYFFLNSHTKRYVNELAKLLEVDPMNLYRKLKELEQEGLLRSEFSGKQRYFSLNKKFPLLKDYRHIFLQTVGFEKRLAAVLKKVSGITGAYLYGSYAKNHLDAASDIDVLVVGNHSSFVLQRSIVALQKQVGREINVVNLGPREFRAKRQQHNPFIKNVLSGKHIKLL